MGTVGGRGRSTRSVWLMDCGVGGGGATKDEMGVVRSKGECETIRIDQKESERGKEV